MESSRQQTIRGSILHFVEDPAEHDAESTFEYHDDGLLIVEHGYIAKVGSAQELLPAFTVARP